MNLSMVIFSISEQALNHYAKHLRKKKPPRRLELGGRAVAAVISGEDTRLL